MRIFQRLKNMLLYKKHGWLTTNAKDFESAGKMMQEGQRVFIKLPDITSSREKNSDAVGQTIISQKAGSQ